MGVVGGGSWGTAIAHLLRCADTPALLWLRDKETARSIQNKRQNTRYLPELTLAKGIETTTDLEEITRRCSLIFVVVPSKSFRAVARTMGDSLLADHLVVSCSKGLEPGSGKRMTELLREETCCLRVGALSGPNLAREVVAGDPGATVVASNYDEVIIEATRALMGPRFRVYGNNDVIGVELAGALKNVAAIGAGIAASMGFGANTNALLVTRALAEIRRLGTLLGADPMTFAGLAGIGDLLVTCGSPLSRNHQVGRRLGQGQTLEQIREEMHQVAEGVNTARVAKELAEKHAVSMPLAQGVYELIYEQRPVADVLAGLMANPALYEIDRLIAV